MGGTGKQMGGWYRKEIKTVDDFKGLKFRVGGIAGQILGKLGTIDTAECVGPYNDEKLASNKVVPPAYRKAIEVAANEVTLGMLANYDNPAALRRVVASGVKLLPFPTAVLEACFNAINELCNESVTMNPKFKKVWDVWKPYRSEQVLWSCIAEGGFDGFMARMCAAGKV